MQKSLPLVVLAVSIIFIEGCSASASTPPKSAVEILTAIQHQLSQADSFSVDFSIDNTTAENNSPRTSTLNGSILLSGKEKMKYTLTAQERSIQLLRDGQTQWVYLPEDKQAYQEEITPRAEFLAFFPNQIFKLTSLWWSDYLHRRPWVLDTATTIAFAQKTMDEGTKTMEDRSTINIEYEDFSVVLSLSEQEPFRIKQLDFDMTERVKTLVPPGRDVSASASYQFSNWKLNPDLEPSIFTFTPGSDITTQKVPDQFPNSLVNQPAPPVKLPLLEGGEFNLADHKGKNLVILDFWATWCQPCRQLMPVMEKVVEAYKEKDIVLCTINQSDNEEAIRAFMENLNIDPPVAQDHTGETAQAYGALKIPFVVVIGKDGVVKGERRGMSLHFREEFMSDLDRYLSE